MVNQTTVSGWPQPWVSFECKDNPDEPGSMDINITNVSSNSMRINVTTQLPQPSSLSKSPFFFAWDTKEHNAGNVSKDPFFTDAKIWFIQEEDNSSSLTINHELLQRAINSIYNSFDPYDTFQSYNPFQPVDNKMIQRVIDTRHKNQTTNFERLTILTKSQLKSIYDGELIHTNMHNEIVINTDKKALIQFYQDQMIRPGTTYYVYVFRYGDESVYHTSRTYPIVNDNNVITTPFVEGMLLKDYTFIIPQE